MVTRTNVAFARQLRANDTDAETKLWNRLRNRKLGGFKFRRQFPIDRFIVDFVCLEAKIIVELDGGQHSEQMDYDTKRTEVLEACGFQVLRFWNSNLLSRTDDAVEAIWRALNRVF